MLGRRLQLTESWRVQSTHQRGTCRERTGRDGERSISHNGVLICKFMCVAVLQKRREQSRTILKSRNGENSRENGESVHGENSSYFGETYSSDSLNSVWNQKPQALSIDFNIFLERANALWAETGGGNIDLQVSMLDCMDFSSINWFSCIESEHWLVSILIWCSTEKKWGKETLKPESTNTWKLKLSEDKLCTTICLQALPGSMQ